MRLDKYILEKGYAPTRSRAQDLIQQGCVSIQDKIVTKASYDVKVGDVLELHFGEKVTKFEVLDVKEHTTKDGAAELYRVVN